MLVIKRKAKTKVSKTKSTTIKKWRWPCHVLRIVGDINHLFIIYENGELILAVEVIRIILRGHFIHEISFLRLKSIEF